MKITLITSELSTDNGWGRYSLDLIKALKNSSVEVVVVDTLPNPLDYFKNYFLAPWYAWKLMRRVQESDIVHVLIEPYSYIGYWLSKMTNKNYFITVHGTYGVMPYYFPYYKRYFHKISFENSKGVICISNYTERRMRKFGLKNLTVINNGVNTSNFKQDSLKSLEQKENIVLSVGALKYRKGYHVSIPAFAKAKINNRDLMYYIVGDQSDVSYFNHLKSIVSNLDLGDSVVFLSSLTNQELQDLYNKSKLFVLTPVSGDVSFEGFGLVYLEANACGLPTVGSLESGAEDAIKNESTGLLVPQNDIDALSKAICRMLDDSELAAELSRNGVDWAKQHNWNNIVSDYLKVYTQ